MKSDLEALNRMLGEIPQGKPFAMYSDAEVGKTILSLHMAVSAAAQLDCNILWINADKPGVDDQINAWVPRLSERFGWKGKLILKELYASEIREEEYTTKKGTKKKRKVGGYAIIDIMDLFGWQIGIRAGKENKLVYVRMKLLADKVETHIEKRNCKVIVIDSVSEPLKIWSDRENLPERSKCIKNWFGKIFLHCKKHKDIVYITIHHSTIEPAPYAPKKMYGGNLRFKFGEVIYITKLWGKKSHRVRKLMLARHESKDSWAYGQEEHIILLDDGYHDLSEAQLKALREKKE